MKCKYCGRKIIKHKMSSSPIMGYCRKCKAVFISDNDPVLAELVKEFTKEDREENTPINEDQ